MPSTKKRINLTIPDAVYERLQVFKDNNGISNDATACLQLIVQQLKAQEETELMLKALRYLTPEDAKKIAAEGIAEIKAHADVLTGL